jgi:hypothetical protein
MAINEKNITSEKGDLAFDNGDFAALNQLVESWGFKDRSSALKFAMAVLLKTDNKSLFVDQNGTHVKITPGDHLLKNSESGEDPRGAVS